MIVIFCHLLAVVKRKNGPRCLLVCFIISILVRGCTVAVASWLSYPPTLRSRNPDPINQPTHRHCCYCYALGGGG